jgi:hypothetical protein
VVAPRPSPRPHSPLAPLAGPDLERGNELRLVDQAVLEGQEAEEEIAGVWEG